MRHIRHGGRFAFAEAACCSPFGISNGIAVRPAGAGSVVSVIQDSLETALSSSGDVLFTATAEFHD